MFGWQMKVEGKKVKGMIVEERKWIESEWKVGWSFSCLVLVKVVGKKDLYSIKWPKYPYKKVIYISDLRL